MSWVGALVTVVSHGASPVVIDTATALAPEHAAIAVPSEVKETVPPVGVGVTVAVYVMGWSNTGDESLDVTAVLVAG
jgi:hypothetical protein